MVLWGGIYRRNRFSLKFCPNNTIVNKTKEGDFDFEIKEIFSTFEIEKYFLYFCTNGTCIFYLIVNIYSIIYVSMTSTSTNNIFHYFHITNHRLVCWILSFA